MGLKFKSRLAAWSWLSLLAGVSDDFSQCSWGRKIRLQGLCWLLPGDLSSLHMGLSIGLLPEWVTPERHKVSSHGLLYDLISEVITQTSAGAGWRGPLQSMNSRGGSEEASWRLAATCFWIASGSGESWGKLGLFIFWRMLQISPTIFCLSFSYRVLVIWQLWWQSYC